MKTLKIADHLSLPLDIVTQAVGILAKRRSGKSFAARRLTEQLLHAGQQVVIVDPKGDWWGIRSSSDGKSPGFPVVILGGEHGDAPLQSTSGEVVAKLAVEERVSLLLDLSAFRKHEVATFMTNFLETIYRLKAREVYRTPMMLMIDEADAIAPQKPQRGEERMLGAAEDIVRRGGQRGIGVCLISQRSAVVNKNVLTQIQVLVALRTIAPQDIAALDAWIDVHGTDEERKTLMASLPSLPTGDAWFWSPGWPSAEGIFQRVHVLPIETFDSGATPKPGEKRAEPRNLADVDLEALRRQMAETLEKAKADDPRELRRRIAELEKARSAQIPPTPPAKAEIKEVPVLKDAQIKRLEMLVDRLNRIAEDILESGRGVMDSARKASSRPQIAALAPRPGRVAAAQAPAQRRAPRPTGPILAGEVGNGGLRRILISLAQCPNGLTARQIGVRAGLSSKSGTFSNYISTARRSGWIEGSGVLVITWRGVEVLGSFEPLPQGQALLSHWLRELGGSGAARMLQALSEVYPNSMTPEALGNAAGMSHQSGTFSNYLSKLRTLELIQGRGEIRLSEELVS